MMMGTSGASSFIEVDSSHRAKHGQSVSGDVFLSQKISDEDRVLSVLSDGLGSGVKANVLATLTATMALKYTSSFYDVRKSAETIMDTLPICSVRKISYSTFTIVDIDTRGKTRIIEHGNPSLLVVRPTGEVPVQRSMLRLKKWQDRLISYSEFEAKLGDRIVFFSDGVAQAGMGEFKTPLGWTTERVQEFVSDTVGHYTYLSAHDLARSVVRRAEELDAGDAKDDITCAVIYFRTPREMLVVTGPPFSRDSDDELGRMVDSFSGRKAICGGTTAMIIERITGRRCTMDLSQPMEPGIPPTSYMDGIDLVTEGTLTLGEVARLLEDGSVEETLHPHAAQQLVRMLLNSDIVHFLVGTRINEAHQDPNIPVELDLRRNIVRRITQQLEHKYLKQTTVRFI
jgi:hypothetical protein